MDSFACSDQYLLLSAESMPHVAASCICSPYRRVTGSQLHTPFMSAHCRRGNAVMPIRFFKIILKTNLERLKIPSKFTRKYGGGLSNPVFVKPPDGTRWEVYWTKHNGEVWFEKGWKEFTENYSLDHGCLVVFKYEGTSQFDVIILEESAVEIDYPSYITGDEKGNHDQSDDESVKILEEIPPHQKARRRLPSFSPQPHKKIRGEKAAQRTSSLNWPKEPRAQELAENFISYDPFFTVFIKPYHLATYTVCVPSFKGYIDEDKVMDVKLQIGKRSWHVKLLQCHRPSYRCLSAGWSLFAKESELQPEDVCIFELINMGDAVFKVHVFKRHS